MTFAVTLPRPSLTPPMLMGVEGVKPDAAASAAASARMSAAIEPLLPDELMRENRMGMTEVLAWQHAPKVTAVCSATGELLLEAVEISAGQLIELPRVLDGSDRDADEGPEGQLTELSSASELHGVRGCRRWIT